MIKFLSLLLLTLSLSTAFSQVAGYSFDNGNANDEIGSNDGTVVGASLAADRFGNANQAYSFDGVDDYIDFGDAPEFQFDSGDFSISLWVKFDSAQEAYILSKRAGISQDYSQYGISTLDNPYSAGSSEKIQFFSRSSNPTVFRDRLVSSGDSLSGAWRHIVVVYDFSDSTAIYVDGRQNSKVSNMIRGHHDVPGFPLVLGYSSESNSFYYKGLADDLYIYRSLLSEQQIDSLYNGSSGTLSLSKGVKTDNSFIVFPNPTSDLLHINNDLKYDRCAFFDLKGKLVLESEQQPSIDISKLKQGTYTVRFYENDQLLSSKKIVKR